MAERHLNLSVQRPPVLFDKERPARCRPDRSADLERTAYRSSASRRASETCEARVQRTATGPHAARRGHRLRASIGITESAPRITRQRAATAGRVAYRQGSRWQEATERQLSEVTDEPGRLAQRPFMSYWHTVAAIAVPAAEREPHGFCVRCSHSGQPTTPPPVRVEPGRYGESRVAAQRLL